MPLNQPSYRVVEGGQHNLHAAEHLQPPKAAQTNLINIGALLIRIWFWGSIGIKGHYITHLQNFPIRRYVQFDPSASEPARVRTPQHKP